MWFGNLSMLQRCLPVLKDELGQSIAIGTKYWSKSAKISCLPEFAAKILSIHTHSWQRIHLPQQVQRRAVRIIHDCGHHVVPEIVPRVRGQRSQVAPDKQNPVVFCKQNIMRLRIDRESLPAKRLL